ncbi:MAG: diphthine--ammonia ligase [Candidatus Lokiarchaeota archaeon]|nr:diphthine--ammonia ligase [Candidatus Lokiarchaeota archaeon]
MKVAVSWSGGKESCLACYKALLQGHDVSFLLNFTSFEKRSMFHNLRDELIEIQSQAIEIPLIQHKTTMNTYEKEFKSALKKFKEMGIEGIVFGDIHEIPKHEGWVDKMCKEIDLISLKPLWKNDPQEVLQDFIDSGFKATVIKIKDDKLNEEFLGRELNTQFIEDLQKYDDKISICGEFGEYHTYVTDGPLFKRNIKILNGNKIFKYGYWHLDITKFEIHSR